jgi:hypothetical protein
MTPTTFQPRSELVHRRTMDFTGYELDDETMGVVARLTDERPWAGTSTRGSQLHDMTLEVQVRLADLAITASSAFMVHHPHAECPDITPVFSQLIGLSVGRGFNKEVVRLFSGVSGCAHLDQLARALGPAIVQSAISIKASHHDPSTPRPSNAHVAGSCHIWAPNGVGNAKLALGWHPGDFGYPAPPIEQVRVLLADPKTRPRPS